MFREALRQTASWLRRAVTQPQEELNRWQRAARFAYDLGRYGARQLREDRAPQMAAALAFHTLFGLAPVLIVATIVVKAMRGSDALLSSLRDLLVAGGLDKIQVVSPSESGRTTVTLAGWLEDLVSQLAHTNLAAVGWVGFAVIIYAAISLMVTIEKSFNVIYRAPEGRPWTRRVPLYWFLLTLSPVAIGLVSYCNNQFDTWIASVAAWQWLLLTARTVWNLGFAWLFMFAVYTLVPNSTVALRPAITGALVAAAFLEIGKQTLGAYLQGAFSINQLYGSLGLVPLFMFWVYLMWLAVLFGLQVSATLQMLQGRTLDEIDRQRAPTGIVDPASVLNVMEFIAEQFMVGRAVTSRQVADVTGIPENVIARIVERLTHEGWLHRVQRPEVALSLAKPPDQMDANEFVELGYRMVDEGTRGRRSALSKRLRDAQKSLVEGMTLAALVRATPTVPSGDAP